MLTALLGRPGVPGLVDRLVDDGDRHAPHLIDVEVVHALRRLVLIPVISDDRAEEARADFGDLAIVRYPHMPLTDRHVGPSTCTYRVRRSVRSPGAEALGVPLVTCDGPLARAPGHGQ